LESSTSNVYSQKGSDVFNLKVKSWSLTKTKKVIVLFGPRSAASFGQTAHAFKPRHTTLRRFASRMAAAKDDAQINDAFAVMQRAAKGKAKAITTQAEQATDLPWSVCRSVCPYWSLIIYL
jgi:hypothetical protein